MLWFRVTEATFDNFMAQRAVRRRRAPAKKS